MAKIDFTMLIPRADEIKLAQALQLSGLILKRSLSDMIRMTARFYIKSASSLTKTSKKNRRKRAIAKSKKRLIAAGVTHRIWKYNRTLKKSGWIFAKGDEEARKKALIKNRGLYAFLWHTLLPKIGYTNSKRIQSSKASQFARGRTRVINKLGMVDPHLILTAGSTALRKMGKPGITSIHTSALRRAKSRMLGWVRSEVKKKLDKQNRRYK